MVSSLFCQEADGSLRPLRPPPGLGCSARGQLLANDNMSDWFRFLLDSDDTRGNWILGF